MKIRLEAVQERDIDLLIMEEFASDKNFAQIFLDAVTFKNDYKIKEIIHSKTDSTLGESDVVIILEIDGGLHALHIEDKIDALAMPRQYDRYVLRAEKDVSNGEYDSYSICIVAPEKYLEINKEAKKYPHSVKYEQMREFFLTKKDMRSKCKLALIDRALFEQKNGYQWEANRGVVAFCTAMNKYKKTKYLGLPDGTVSWWPSYPTIIKDTSILFKANKGFCDLQFGHTIATELYPKIARHLSERMNVVQTNKSASVRIVVTPICLEDEFEGKLAEVDEALKALWELYELSKEIAIEGIV